MEEYSREALSEKSTDQGLEHDVRTMKQAVTHNAEIERGGAGSQAGEHSPIGMRKEVLEVKGVAV